MMHACIYIHARPATPMNGSPMRARRTRSRMCCARVHACARAIGRAHIRADTRKRIPSASTACGSQAFRGASAFNANIGAWNTARVTSLSYVCAAFSAGRRTTAAGRARRVVDAALAIVCAHACMGGHVCRYSCAYERGVIRLYACMYVALYTD